ncbi:dienelactone hydrolase family protein [Angustibacter sp. McL0619]|uniref:dienelactone hydrolase family protein n=1 Tax=Angustibacter sp. McL0619 TaxID=3415676 RepID=UPI003CE69F4C
MTQIVLFHSVLGVRPGVLDAAERLRADGHDVLVPDLYDGKVFDDYDPAMAFQDELGDELWGRALQAVADLPDGFVTAGFSAGGGRAVFVATRRPVSGVLLFAEATLVEWFGDDVRWPQGVPAQVHFTLGDPWREQPVVEQFVKDVQASGGRVDVYDYPGEGHLFTDPSLPKEYDAESAELAWSRALAFLRGLEV